MGDVVRDCLTGKMGIVETSQSEWIEYEKVLRTIKGVDFYDSGITVEILGENGFYHDHISPFILEKTDIFEEGEHQLLSVGSRLLKGEASLEWFSRVYVDYLKNKSNHN